MASSKDRGLQELIVTKAGKRLPARRSAVGGLKHADSWEHVQRHHSERSEPLIQGAQSRQWTHLRLVMLTEWGLWKESVVCEHLWLWKTASGVIQAVAVIIVILLLNYYNYYNACHSLNANAVSACEGTLHCYLI